MARSIQLLCLTFQILFLLLPILSVNGSNLLGLTIKLIHRDSPDSPLYKPNLTRTERAENLVLQSIARSIYFAERGQNESSTTALRSTVDQYYNAIFMAQVGIGTFRTSPPLHYFLHMDTGSSLSWTQCEACRSVGHHCFYQRAPVFPNSRSSTYQNLVYDRNPLCYPNQHSGNLCTYTIRYMDGANTRGFLASESFTFDSTTTPHGKETIPGIVFGCGVNQENMGYGNPGKIAGMLGLGWGPRSLLAQLGPRAGSRFSYCFQSKNADPGVTTTLRFGSDIPTPAGLRTTALVQDAQDDQAYFVNLVDVSVADRRLGIPAAYFSRRAGGGGGRRRRGVSGVVIDSGTTFTMMVEPAYEAVERAVERYLTERMPGARRAHVGGSFGFCYDGPAGRGPYDGLPRLTFHFDGGADMVVEPRGGFFVGGPMRPYFCLAVVPSRYDASHGGVSILGGLLQTDHRVIYDVGRRQLQFAPQDCSTTG